MSFSTEVYFFLEYGLEQIVQQYEWLERDLKVRIEELRRNPPDVGVTSGQKSSTKIIYIILQTSVGLFKLSSQNNSFLATPNVENEC